MSFLSYSNFIWLLKIIMKKIKPIIYIFCEWRTEERYFKKMSKLFNSSFNVIPYDLKWWYSIVNKPEKIKRIIEWKVKHNKIPWVVQKVFIVFDLDIFNKTQLQNTQNILKNYHLIYNNETFEYWILSHFKKYNLWNWKEKYLNEIRNYLPNLWEWQGYKMTKNEDYNWLENLEKVYFAIQNVKSVNSEYWNFKDRNPYSNIYEIIEYLEETKATE